MAERGETKSAMVTYGRERRNKIAKDDEIPLIPIRDRKFSSELFF